MKNIIIYLSLCIASTNYSQTKSTLKKDEKEKLEAINDYFITIVKDSNRVVFIAQEKLNSNLTLEIFKQNFIQAIDLKGNIEPDTHLFNEKDWKKFKKQNQDPPIQDNRIWDTHKYWGKNDFSHSQLIFESMNTKTGIELIIEKYDKSDVCIYSFSEPMYYLNKKHLIFTNLKICISGGSKFVVIMKKIKGKWIRTHEAFNPNETY
ncbi:hypothetical protein H4V97_001911 [Flavobacterium sp. CG_23.5]|uniref:hypothetical protein n=1 Tax=Flavobacterium sp. CG_23.5 TaxID=2760708 RepID=UPI001AE75FEF|nr:hypothetical protein [Flavobacterium sp. CG_23.5]MBP2283593.1 hypothetical protein [Flavobacterium sp. CG_23.5]